MMRLRTKISVIFFVLFAVGIIFLSFVIISNFQATLRAHLVEHLVSTSQSAYLSVNTYLTDFKSGIVDFSSDGKIKSCIDGYGCTSDELSFHLIKNKIPARPNLVDLFVLDTKGIVYGAVHKTDIGRDLNREPLFRQVKKGPALRVLVIDGKPVMRVMAPIGRTTASNETVGYIIGDYDGRGIDRFMVAPDVLGPSGEVLMAYRDERGDAVYFTKRKFSQSVGGAVPNGTLGVPMMDALSDINGLRYDLHDYRGVKVLSSTQYIRQYDLGLVVKMDEAEAFAPIQKANHLVLFLASMTIFLATLIIIGVSTKISDSITSLTDDVDKISRGDFDIELKKSDLDEINSLTASLGRVLASMKLAVLRSGAMPEIVPPKEEVKETRELSSKPDSSSNPKRSKRKASKKRR